METMCTGKMDFTSYPNGGIAGIKANMQAGGDEGLDGVETKDYTVLQCGLSVNVL